MKTRYVKLSPLVIASESGREVYRSTGEIPAGVRERLMRSTSGENSGTIWIADRNGRAEIARASSGIFGGAKDEFETQVWRRAERLPVWLIRVLGFVLAAGAAAVSWFSFHSR